MQFRHSHENHGDAEGDWYYVEYSSDGEKWNGFGPVPKEVAEKIVGESAINARLQDVIMHFEGKTEYYPKMAAKYLREFAARIKELQEGPKWISMKKQTPVIGEVVLVIRKNEKIQTALWTSTGDGPIFSSNGGWIEDALGWMHIPKYIWPMKGEKEK